MIAPKFPENERKRQKAVEKYKLLDTNPEEKYDNITSLISTLCDTPIALITMLDNDRNFLKSHYGVPFSESPRNISFCGHAINGEEQMMIVKDAREDNRFHDNPLVKDFEAIFYAGVPLINNDGYKLGTLCIYDHKPRTLNTDQKEALIILAKQVVMLFEQRIQNDKLLFLKESLLRKNENLEKFASVVSHDLKSPVNNIISLTELLKDENKNLSEDSQTYIRYLQESSESLKSYIDGVLNYYKSDEYFGLKKEVFDISELITECSKIVDIKSKSTISLENNCKKSIHANKTALKQVLINLITNAIKYNDKESIIINISCNEDLDYYYFEVKDNGRGISNQNLENIFELFKKTNEDDRFGNKGNGIGLATVKKIVTTLGGDISVTSILRKESNFKFYIEKE